MSVSKLKIQINFYIESSRFYGVTEVMQKRFQTYEYQMRN